MSLSLPALQWLQDGYAGFAWPWAWLAFPLPWLVRWAWPPRRAQADALAARLLSRLPQVPCSSLPPLPVVPEVAPLEKAEEINIPFDSAQAHVYIGQPGIKRNNPDYFSLIVGNYILGGGGFVSRLTTEVRERRGLSYSVFSDFSPGLHAGAFTIGLQTRPDQANEAVQVVRDVLTGFVKGGPTEVELEAAKSNLIGGFALRIDSNRKLLGNVANIAWNGLPLDYLDTWTQQVARVSTADIRNAFSRTLQPSTMAIRVCRLGSANAASWPNSVMSAPPENALPAPVSTIACTWGSSWARCRPAASAWRMACPRLLTGGRSRVSTATSVWTW